MLHKLFHLICFLFAANFAFSQTAPVKKIYAYRQTVEPGKKPEPNETVKKKEQFSLYLEVAKNQTITFSGIWIDNNYYYITSKKAVKSPVEKATVDGAGKFIAVPKTVNDLYEIVLGKKQEPSPRPGTKLGSYLQNNEIVLYYNYKGKPYFSMLKKMKLLETISLM
jgi:hypothetical protein